jgi:Lrp/AsnC family transcriptional regulator for asnA, asnC and gidA
MEEPKITPIDVRIIGCLQRDARKSFVKIADELHVPESTVRHRLNRLVRHGIVEFAAVTNPLRMGYQVWAIIEIQGEPSRIPVVARQLAKAPETFFVGITTGRCDIFVSAVFRSNDELLDFLTTRLAKIRGITRTSTSTVLEVVKRTLALSVPKSPATRRGPARTSRRQRS